MHKFIPILLVVVLIVSGCAQSGDISKPDTSISPTNSQQTSDPKPNKTIDNQVKPNDLDLTTVYGCAEDSDCVIGAGVCGTAVYNKDWDWENPPEQLKEWAKDEKEKIEGITCAVGKYASNPRCENSTCTGDYNQF